MFLLMLRCDMECFGVENVGSGGGRSNYYEKYVC